MWGVICISGLCEVTEKVYGSIFRSLLEVVEYLFLCTDKVLDRDGRP